MTYIIELIIHLIFVFINCVDSNTGNNFTCSCSEGYEGALCDLPYCERTPCLNQGLCTISEAMVSLKIEINNAFTGLN